MLWEKRGQWANVFGNYLMPYLSLKVAMYVRVLEVLRRSAVMKRVQFFAKPMGLPFQKYQLPFFNTKYKYCSKETFYYIWESIELENFLKCKII